MNARDLRVRGPWLAAAWLLCGCASAPRDWRDLGVRALPFEDVWDGVIETSRRHGFVPDERETDRGRGLYLSRWRTSTQGFGTTRRLRVRAEMTSAEQPDARLAWQLRFRVERQSVPDMARSMNPRESDWEDDGQETGMEDVIETQLRLRFGDRDVLTERSSRP